MIEFASQFPEAGQDLAQEVAEAVTAAVTTGIVMIAVVFSPLEFWFAHGVFSWWPPSVQQDGGIEGQRVYATASLQ